MTVSAVVTLQKAALEPVGMSIAMGGPKGREDVMRVREVDSCGPAQNAGIQTGDIVLAVNGKPISTLEALVKSFGEVNGRFVVQAQGGQQLAMSKNAEGQAGMKLVCVAAPVVTKVFPNSPAARAGLRVGDTICSINGRFLPTIESVEREVASEGEMRIEVRLPRPSSNWLMSPRTPRLSGRRNSGNGDASSRRSSGSGPPSPTPHAASPAPASPASVRPVDDFIQSV
eukprot:CAMPEP_0174722076 /NCGR_PEP_ID=MMETSP1094-20130205/37604_1 /TAXON_ID=156173 /ORGANISM="Chrysochromulina brevifilum, Strain UTEX LB 985" /LENGTH=227 /DNA_ID=CAMNT_0015922863 /DNA_START=101 /DNA_END=784 /DNA_ORIENTATION=+